MKKTKEEKKKKKKTQPIGPDKKENYEKFILEAVQKGSAPT
jgi:hypothetical protein